MKTFLALILILFGWFTMAQSITAAEYFFNTDTGVGTGTPLAVNANSGELIQSYSISTTGLSDGFHSLYIRTRDSNGKWSLYHREIIYIKDFEFIPSEVTNAEYFIDSDPGIGNGIGINFLDPSQSIQMLSFSTTGLTEGDHIFYIRGQNANGIWSIYDSTLFTIDASLGLEDSLFKTTTIYPNPFKSILNIKSSNSLSIQKVTIYGLNGKTVYVSKEDSKYLDLEFLSSGIYILMLHANDKKATFKIVKH